ncbi:MAG: hypothetical protein MK086_03560 [Flavobacteriales bacterium]|nr:hypothetical protein [Flavobacteriales bacterium]
MRASKYIFLPALILLAVSCTKPEEESPDDAAPKNVTDEDFRIINYDQESLDNLEEERDDISPALINDDEDDETGPNRK